MTFHEAFHVNHQFEPATWMTDAACQEHPSELFFPTRGEDAELAKRVCATCPVARTCLDYALRHNELFGIWGGTSERERRRIRRRRKAA